jgi:hypothetical protein
VHPLVVLLGHERGPHRVVPGLARQCRDDPVHPVVDQGFRAVDRPEDALQCVLLRARQPAEALGIGGEVDAVGVPRVDVRGGEDVVEGPPAAGDLPVGGLVVGEQRVDLAQEPRNVRATRRCSRLSVGREAGDCVHAATLRQTGCNT